MSDLQITSDPVLVDGRVVGPDADLRAIIVTGALRRGIDPALLADPTPVLDPRGNVIDHDEAVRVLTEQALAGLGHHADGEFDLDRLPPINEHVARWVTGQQRDPAEVPQLVLRGSTGCGKTSQVFCLLRHLVLHHAGAGRRFNWRFITHRNFAAAVQPGSGRDPDQMMRQLMDADLVAFDDLGDYNTQDFGRAADYTSRLINHRSHHRLATVYNTNLPFTRGPKLLEAEAALGQRIATLSDTLDGRVLSRLKSGWVVTMPDIDYRQQQGQVFGP